MFLLYSSLSRATLGLAALSCMLAAPLYNSVGAAQELSREEATKEAGRLGTEAVRLRGEAYKKVQAGGDRRLIMEAERAAAEKFRQAIELWRAAGDYNRLVAGAEELSRIYFVVNDYERAVGCLKREAEFWEERGDRVRQARTVWLMALRQMQMRRDAAAAETFEKAVELSGAANLFAVERDSLENLARLYDKLGRGAEAESFRARSKQLMWQVDFVPAEVVRRPAPAVIPVQWVDLPSSPLSVEYHDVDGVRKAVLVNRSSKEINMVIFGCVEEHEGKARVTNELTGEARSHGGVGPGSYFHSFAVLNGPLNPWTDAKMGCEGAARLSLTKAVYTDGTSWVAEGAGWLNQ